MAATGNDCYFYYSGSCMKGDSCNFRHQPAAIGSDVTCDLWSRGICTRPVCEFRHAILNKNPALIKCLWEDQPSGCIKPNCAFMHSKPKTVASNISGLIPHPQFPPGSHSFRPLGLGRTDLNLLHQESVKGVFGPNAFVDKALPAAAAGIPSGLIDGGPLHLANAANSLLGNPPGSVVNMLGSDPNQMLLNLADTDNFPEQVKLFQQMLNRLGKHESPKKEKDKSKRRVIPKYSRGGDLKDFEFEKSLRKRDSSKKKKSRDKSKKSDRKERSHKSKSKSGQRKQESRSPKSVQEKDANTDFHEAEREHSEFSESPKSHRSSSEDEDPEFSVKSYEEILREKALRNLLEKKKMREQNESGTPDFSNRAKIEEIEKELREVTRARQRKEKEEGKRVSDEEEVEFTSREGGVESIEKGKDDVEIEKHEGFKVTEAQESTASEMEGSSATKDGESEITVLELEEGEIEDKGSPVHFDEQVQSPVSSEISLQADEEDLSFGEEEDEFSSPKKGLLPVTKVKKKGKGDKESEKGRHQERRKGRAEKEGGSKFRGEKGKTFEKVRKEKNKPYKLKRIEKEEVIKSDDNKNKVAKSSAAVNKSFELGIKTFEEIMAEKRQRKKAEGPGEIQSFQELASGVKQEAAIQTRPESNKPKKEEIERTVMSDHVESMGKKGKRLIRKVKVKDSFVEVKKNESAAPVTLDDQSTDIAQSSNIRNTVLVSIPKKEILKSKEAESSKVEKDVRAQKPPPETKTTTDVQVKSFDEIIREKRARQQQLEGTSESKEKTVDVASSEFPEIAVNNIKRRATGPASEGDRTRRFMAASAVGVNSAKLGAPPSGAGSVTERTRRLLLKRPSSKGKVVSDDCEASTMQKNESDVIMPTTAVSSIIRESNVRPISARLGSTEATVSSSTSQINIVQPAVVGATQSTENEALLALKVTSRNEGGESVIARISPFLVTSAEPPSSMSLPNVPSRTVSSDGVVTSSATVNEDGTVHRPLKSPRERRKSEVLRKRRSNEETKAPGEEHAKEDGQGPSPTKRVKSTSQKVYSEARDVDSLNEALEAKERRNSEVLLDEELEREIANLSPLSAEEYDEINEDDLLMEVDAMINE